MATFEAGTECFGKPTQQWMVNYRVENLDALLEELQRTGVEIVRREEHDYGKFAWASIRTEIASNYGSLRPRRRYREG